MNVQEFFNLYKSKFRLVLGALIAVLVIIFVGAKISEGNKVVSTNTIVSKADVAPAKAKKDINRNFEFPVTDNNGVVITKIGYSIDKAELRDEIVIRGQKATAIKDRTFLILTIKMKNDSDKTLRVNARDYLRLSANKSDWLAPDIHNDPVEVQPISTKISTLGFPIADNQKTFSLRVGEISGVKTTFDLKF